MPYGRACPIYLHTAAHTAERIKIYNVYLLYAIFRTEYVIVQQINIKTNTCPHQSCSKCSPISVSHLSNNQICKLQHDIQLKIILLSPEAGQVGLSGDGFSL